MFNKVPNPSSRLALHHENQKVVKQFRPRHLKPNQYNLPSVYRTKAHYSSITRLTPLKWRSKMPLSPYLARTLERVPRPHAPLLTSVLSVSSTNTHRSTVLHSPTKAPRHTPTTLTWTTAPILPAPQPATASSSSPSLTDVAGAPDAVLLGLERLQ